MAEGSQVVKGRATHWHAGLALAVLPLMGGCASFGSNIAGSFSCPAPDGICAPSSSIDDRALALITAEAPDAVPSPAGPYRDPDMGAGKGARTAVASPRRMPVSIGEAGRTREKVLRIVFQPYIDERGRLHEASAVHAVVAQGEWQQQAIAEASGLSSRNERAAAYAGETLADAVDHAETERLSSAEGLPDPAAVVAARARMTADPVASIKSDVAARLTPRPDARARRKVAATPAQPGSAPVSPAEPTAPPAAAPAPPARAVPSVPQAAAVPGAPAKTTAGAEAAARVKADSRYQAVASQAQDGARAAATGAQAPDLRPVLKPTVSSAPFPGAVAEEN
jgi:conjugal transfer pilus assembly protein TraV